MKLKNCKDIFHVECFVNYADSNLKQSKFPVLHPCTNDCKRFEIFEYEMRKFLPDDKFSKLSELSLKKAIDSSKNMDFCPNINCNYYFAFTDKDHTINCPSCKKFYCLKCKTIKLTEDKFCAKCEYGNEDKAFVKFATDKKLKKCRVCGRVIERTEGCNHMTCKC